MKLDETIFRDKIRGCWFGKGIGGTLGMPYEGYPWKLALSESDLLPTQVPNDDLELQLLWILWAEKHGSALRAENFTVAWDEFYDSNADEYGIARWNIKRGLKPPLTGLHNNCFTDGMGAAIRTEIWACLFPGNPELAAWYAREDAIVDHNGNGIWAAMFLAAAESAAFCCNKPIHAINTGLKYIPDDCKVSKAVKFVQQLYSDNVPLDKTRDLILENYGSHSFTDVSMNLAFITLGLLYGEGNFEKTVLTAVNCGMDADCTGATTAAFMGILLGETGIPPLWKEIIGTDLLVGDCLKDLPLPKTIDEAVDRTLELSERMNNELDGRLPENMTPDVKVDTVDDGNRWLVFKTEGGFDEPAELVEAEKNPTAAGEYLFKASGIHLNLTHLMERPCNTIFLLTWITVPEDLEGQIMLCSDTGLTAWLDGRQILNYHGRLKAIPAFQRTEGGASVAVSLKKNNKHLLKIRLYGHASPLSLSVAVGDAASRYALGVEYSV